MNPRNNMMPGFNRSIMQPSQVAYFLLFIYFLNMMSMMGSTQTYISSSNNRVCARALRVGIGDHAYHAIITPNDLSNRYLEPLHDPTAAVRDHANAVPNKRNLLTLGAIVTSATVPHATLTTLHRKFCGTLTPDHRVVCATFIAFRARQPCLNFY
jgi:hypothetical protein